MLQESDDIGGGAGFADIGKNPRDAVGLRAGIDGFFTDNADLGFKAREAFLK